MLTAKTGPAWPTECRSLVEQLEASLWLLRNDGCNSAGERLPDDSSLAEANGDLDVLTGRTVWMPTEEK